MDAQPKAIAENCLNAAYDKTMTFTEIAEVLIEAGFESYVVDFRRNTTTYLVSDGASIVLENRPSQGAVAVSFNQPGIAAKIKWAQANPSDYSYGTFCKHVKALGCAGYIVSFRGRRVLYFGRTAETYAESFPQ